MWKGFLRIGNHNVNSLLLEETNPRTILNYCYVVSTVFHLKSSLDSKTLQQSLHQKVAPGINR
uniref:Uncharacterized protein n=1 Tax=uncultured marine virus TaxID=186617 RepID=A0A0F7L5E7_9VIRU|nr:hypothetical protein [uncultured marine virus]